MKRANGFTLLEILIVVVIIGILASLAIPRYQKTVEYSKAGEAYANLNAIRTGELNYHARTGDYVTGSIFSGLAIEDPNLITGADFNYIVQDTHTPNNPLITATRTGGLYTGDVIMMDMNSGNISDSGYLTGGGDPCLGCHGGG